MRSCVRLGLVALVTSLPSTAEAQDTQMNRYTLEDLGGVFPRVEVTEACQTAGMSAADFEADVSMSLIEAEVGVLTREEMLQRPALPELRVSIDCAPGSDGTGGAMAYSVSLRVQQAAQMLRDTQITLPEAVTWYSSRIGVASSDAAAEAVGSVLAEQVAAFATAWTEINSAEGEGS